MSGSGQRPLDVILAGCGSTCLGLDKAWIFFRPAAPASRPVGRRTSPLAIFPEELRCYVDYSRTDATTTRAFFNINSPPDLALARGMEDRT